MTWRPTNSFTGIWVEIKPFLHYGPTKTELLRVILPSLGGSISTAAFIGGQGVLSPQVKEPDMRDRRVDSDFIKNAAHRAGL